jgi:post-segregation antitoxin (ccd killing protein)
MEVNGDRTYEHNRVEPELTNLAYEMGLNVSKTCENALKEAIRRLRDSDLDFANVRNAETARFKFS